MVLNSQCGQARGCSAGEPQHDWLIADLDEARASCVIAAAHHPRFSSGTHGNRTDLEPLWRVLYDAGADIFLSAHDHHYERFIRLGPDATPDPVQGITQFVVGTGGRSTRSVAPGIRTKVALNAFGVLELTLREGAYEWRFVDELGFTRDAGRRQLSRRTVIHSGSAGPRPGRSPRLPSTRPRKRWRSRILTPPAGQTAGSRHERRHC